MVGFAAHDHAYQRLVHPIGGWCSATGDRRPARGNLQFAILNVQIFGWFSCQVVAFWYA
jgi:hypothetical protein